MTAHSIRFVLTCFLLLGTVNTAAAQNQRLLVLLRDAAALAIVEPSGKVLGRVPVVKDPHEVAVTPDGQTAYVASPSEGISVVDVRAMKEVRRVDTGAGSAPHDVMFVGGKLLFTAEGYKTIGRYDPAANKVEWFLGIGQDGTHMMVLAKDQQTMWVPNRGSNSVSVIDGVMGGPPKFKVTAIPVPGKMPEGLDLSPATRKVVHSMNLNLNDANRLKFTPDGKVLIIAGGNGTLHILDGKSRKEIKRLQVHTGDSGDGGIYVMPDGSRAYVGLRDADNVVVVNLKTLEIENTWAMGPKSGPGCIILATVK
jgi:DNA-binding beta-propeller fold protein YncE